MPLDTQRKRARARDGCIGMHWVDLSINERTYRTSETFADRFDPVLNVNRAPNRVIRDSTWARVGITIGSVARSKWTKSRCKSCDYSCTMRSRILSTSEGGRISRGRGGTRFSSIARRFEHGGRIAALPSLQGGLLDTYFAVEKRTVLAR